MTKLNAQSRSGRLSADIQAVVAGVDPVGRPGHEGEATNMHTSLPCGQLGGEASDATS
jgi:hypothetical protein